MYCLRVRFIVQKHQLLNYKIYAEQNALDGLPTFYFLCAVFSSFCLELIFCY